MTVQTRSSPWARVLEVWQQNHELLRNAGSLAATTGLTSLFGFVYWIVAAREFTQEAVGYGSASISAIGLLGTVGAFGLGTLLIGELPRREARGGLFAAALATSGLGSLILGLAFPTIAKACGANFPGFAGTPTRVAIFAFGVALTGASLVFDDGTIGLMRGGVQLSRNLVMSVAKLAVLPVMAVVLHDVFGVGLMLAWVIGTAVSFLPAAIMLARHGNRIFHRPDWRLLRRLGKIAMAHNWLNLALATPPRLIPVVVTVVVSPSANAAFYVAFMLSGFLFMIPMSLSTVLFAIVSASPELIAEKLRLAIRVSLMIGLPGMAVLAVGAHYILGIFGPGYSQLATLPLWILIIGYIPGLPKAQYIAVSRATGRVTRAATVLTTAAGCEIAAVVIGGKLGGLDGLTYAYVAVLMVEGFVTAPTVLRAARTAAATGPIPVMPDSIPVMPDAVRVTGPVGGQEVGLAALLALGSVALSEGHSLDAATEVWRTGAFSVIPEADRRDRRDERQRNEERTSTWWYAERRLTEAGSAFTDAGDAVPREAGYGRRQQAGIDALIAMATPLDPDSTPGRIADRSD